MLEGYNYDQSCVLYDANVLTISDVSEVKNEQYVCIKDLEETDGN